MTTEDIKLIVKSEKYNTDVSVYCDNYCKMCCFTSRCVNFQILKNDLKWKDVNDTANTIYWNEILDTYTTTQEKILEFADISGFDLNASIEDDKKCIGSKHKFFTYALRNTKQTEEILDQTDTFMQNRFEKLSAKLKLKLKKKKIESIDKSIIFAKDIIYWYTEQYKYKIATAIELRNENKQNQATGYAKASYSMLKRITALWGLYIENFKESEVEFMPQVINTYWTMLNIERIFPEIKGFKRKLLDN